jgi:hypothetical protein
MHELRLTNLQAEGRDEQQCMAAWDMTVPFIRNGVLRDGSGDDWLLQGRLKSDPAPGNIMNRGPAVFGTPLADDG